MMEEQERRKPFLDLYIDLVGACSPVGRNRFEIHMNNNELHYFRIAKHDIYENLMYLDKIVPAVGLVGWHEMNFVTHYTFSNSYITLGHDGKVKQLYDLDRHHEF